MSSSRFTWERRDDRNVRWGVNGADQPLLCFAIIVVAVANKTPGAARIVTHERHRWFHRQQQQYVVGRCWEGTNRPILLHDVMELRMNPTYQNDARLTRDTAVHAAAECSESTGTANRRLERINTTGKNSGCNGRRSSTCADFLLETSPAEPPSMTSLSCR